MKNKYSDVENFNLQIFNHIKIRGNQDPYIYKYKVSDFCKLYVHVLSMCVFACHDYMIIQRGFPQNASVPVPQPHI